MLKTIDLPKTRVPWLTLAAVGLVIALAFSSILIRPHTDALAGELIAAAYARGASGGMIDLTVAALYWLSWASLSMLLQPAMLIAGLLFIELALGERKPRGRFWATCLYRISLYVSIYFFSILLGRFFGSIPHTTLAQALQVADPHVRLIAQVGLLLVWLIAWDFISYWVHRAFHQIPLLWRIHSVHHSSRNLGVWHNITHPLEAALLMVSLYPLGLLVGADGRDAFVLFLLVSLHSHIVHMDAPLHFGRFNRFLVDNRYHFLHHSREPADYNRNFATLLPFWDMVFRTYKEPPKTRLCETGILGYDSPQSMRQFLLARLPADNAPHSRA
jgi:sterol desaturase/sphingolipid hydroxylase (fatty acid hydroxylase superfamily)